MKKGIFLLMTVLLVATCVGCAGDQKALEEEIINLKVENELLKKNITNTEEAVVQLEEERDNALQRVEELESQTDGELIAERDAALEEAERLGKTVFDLEATISELQAELGEFSLASLLPEELRNSKVVSSYAVSTIQGSLKGEVSDINLEGRTVTLSRGGDTVTVFIRPDAFSGVMGETFDLEGLEVGEKITVSVFYSPVSDSLEGVAVYTGDTPMNKQ